MYKDTKWDCHCSHQHQRQIWVSYSLTQAMIFCAYSFVLVCTLCVYIYIVYIVCAVHLLHMSVCAGYRWESGVSWEGYRLATTHQAPQLMHDWGLGGITGLWWIDWTVWEVGVVDNHQIGSELLHVCLDHTACQLKNINRIQCFVCVFVCLFVCVCARTCICVCVRERLCIRMYPLRA